MATASTTKPPTTGPQPTAQYPENISILDAIAASEDGKYHVPLLPDDEVFSISVVSEITTDGWVQNLRAPIFLPRVATWREAQESLKMATISWQTESWGYGGDGCEILPDGKWLYQVSRNDKPEAWKRLGTEREWRALRRAIVEGEGMIGVVVWHEVVHVVMSARKTLYDADESDDLVDFHNACEMDVALSLPNVEVKEENGIEKRRRLSGERGG